ncbi:MAG: family N-acetyltransferase [Frankiales bacterium]|jgi:GNAT superfamily N-acetyltransferase|nr:family N-acetyltransferase [Frankiales bacterium]
MRSVDNLARQRAATFRFWRDDVAVRPAGDWADLGGVQVHTTGLAPRHWNGAHVARPVDLRPMVPKIAAWFAERDKPWGLLIPAELGLTPPGLTYSADQQVMLRDLVDLPSLALPDRIVVTDRAPTADVARVQSEAFGDPYDVTLAFVTPGLGPKAAPPQNTLTAYDGVEAVGCATVAVMDGVAGIYGVAVRDAWRRRGIGAALTALCMHRAVADGCDLAYLNPSQIGHRMYSLLGFADTEPMRIWLPD